MPAGSWTPTLRLIRPRFLRDSGPGHENLTRLYAKAGIKGGTSHSARRAFAGKVLASTGDMDTVARLLG